MEAPGDDQNPDVIRVNGQLSIPMRELTWRFAPSGGPGGQHANKVSSRAELRWDVVASPSLTEVQRARLVDKLGGEVRISVDEARSQLRNRSLAVDRLGERVAEALRREVARRPTKPSKGSQRRRLDAKKQRSQIKRGRGRVDPGD